MASTTSLESRLRKLTEQRQKATQRPECSALDRETRLVQIRAHVRAIDDGTASFRDVRDERRCRRIVTTLNAAAARRDAALYGEFA